MLLNLLLYFDLDHFKEKFHIFKSVFLAQSQFTDILSVLHDKPRLKKLKLLLAIRLVKHLVKSITESIEQVLHFFISHSMETFGYLFRLLTWAYKVSKLISGMQMAIVFSLLQVVNFL